MDKFAVAIMKSGGVVGHVLYNLAPTLSQFLNFNKAVAEITGDRVNRKAGYVRLSTIIWIQGLRG